MMTPEFVAVRTKLIDITREGPASEWTERLRIYAVDSGLNDAMINWNQNPLNLAHDIIKKCCARDKLDKLLEKMEFFT